MSYKSALILACPTCKQKSSFDMGDMTESATLTCPICSTTFAISATIQQTVKGKETPEFGGAELGGLSKVGGTPPSDFTRGSPTPEVPTPESAIAKAIRALTESGELDLDLSIVDMLEAEDTWSGDLATFIMKMQSLVDDISIGVDIGDLISDMCDAGAIKLTSDGVTLNLSKAQKCIEKSSDNVPELEPDFPIGKEDKEDEEEEGEEEEKDVEGEHEEEDEDLEFTDIAGDIGVNKSKLPGMGKVKSEPKLKKSKNNRDSKVAKAIKTYFS